MDLILDAVLSVDALPPAERAQRRAAAAAFAREKFDLRPIVEEWREAIKRKLEPEEPLEAANSMADVAEEGISVDADFSLSYT